MLSSDSGHGILEDFFEALLIVYYGELSAAPRGTIVAEDRLVGAVVERGADVVHDLKLIA